VLDEGNSATGRPGPTPTSCAMNRKGIDVRVTGEANERSATPMIARPCTRHAPVPRTQVDVQESVAEDDAMRHLWSLPVLIRTRVRPCQQGLDESHGEGDPPRLGRASTRDLGHLARTPTPVPGREARYETHAGVVAADDGFCRTDATAFSRTQNVSREPNPGCGPAAALVPAERPSPAQGWFEEGTGADEGETRQGEINWRSSNCLWCVLQPQKWNMGQLRQAVPRPHPTQGERRRGRCGGEQRGENLGQSGGEHSLRDPSSGRCLPRLPRTLPSPPAPSRSREWWMMYVPEFTRRPRPCAT
jgi:hypothetical protein